MEGRGILRRACPAPEGERKVGWVSVDFELVNRETYLECIVTGEFELEEAKRAFSSLIKAWTEANNPRLLIDIRQLRIPTPISFRERFDFAQYAARVAIHARARGLSVKSAVFLGSRTHVDSQRIGATVATNRGAKVRVTTDEAEALAWLGVETQEKPGHESATHAGS